LQIKGDTVLCDKKIMDTAWNQSDKTKIGPSQQHKAPRGAGVFPSPFASASSVFDTAICKYRDHECQTDEKIGDQAKREES
jgi:hypothetical protein